MKTIFAPPTTPRNLASAPVLGAVIYLLALSGSFGQPVPPTITNQPASQTAELGANVTFSVGVTGSAPLRYQWRQDNQDLLGKTNASLVLTNLDASPAGNYSVVVTNSVGTNTSVAAGLLILPPVFTKITNSPIVNTLEAHRIATWGDYNNDGLLDVFLTGGSIAEGPHTNSLYRNNGDGTFTLDLLNPVMRVSSNQFACAWGDFDNDGYLDLFVTNFDLLGRNALYRNNGDGTFHRLGSALFERDNSESYGCAWGDYDNDGFLDLVIANGSSWTAWNNFLYRNNGNTNHWLKFRCVGVAANRSGIGTKVRVLATIRGAARWQLQVIGGQDGLGAQNGLLAHFGLGDTTNVSTFRIEWPSGIVQTLTNVATNQCLTVVEHQLPGPAAPPQITGVATATNGIVNLSIVGDTGLLYVLEASTNLLNWTKLAVRSNATGSVEFTDPKATNYATRFYRVVIP